MAMAAFAGAAGAAPAPFLLGEPADGAFVATARPKLTWSSTTAQDGMDGYGVVVDDNVAGVVDAAACQATCELTPAALTDGVHKWSVIAADTASGTTESDERTFTVDTTPPSPPVITSGSRNATTTTIAWSASGDAGSGLAGYEVRRYGVLLSTTTDTTYSAPSLSGIETWRVTALDRAGNPSSSSEFKVGTARPLGGFLATPKLTIIATPLTPWLGQPVALHANTVGPGTADGAQYEWDLDGNGTYETPTGDKPDAQVTFTTPGNHMVAVQATTSAGRLRPTVRGINARTPTGRPTITIDDGAKFSGTRLVTVTLGWPSNATGMTVGNTTPIAPIGLSALAGQLNWTLAGSGLDGKPSTVYAAFATTTAVAGPVHDDIIVDLRRPKLSSAVVHGRQLRLRASDRISGLAQAQTAVDRSHPAETRRFRHVLRLGKHERVRWVRVLDRVGNRSAWRRVRGR